jgi:Bromodomain extra-terminal - transcription regulation
VSAAPASAHIRAAAPPPRAAPAPPPVSFPQLRSEHLFDWIGNASEDMQGAVVDFLQRAGHSLAGDDGEVELDPESLPPDVLWRLDAFCRSTSGGGYAPA